MFQRAITATISDDFQQIFLCSDVMWSILNLFKSLNFFFNDWFFFEDLYPEISAISKGLCGCICSIKIKNAEPMASSGIGVAFRPITATDASSGVIPEIQENFFHGAPGLALGNRDLLIYGQIAKGTRDRLQSVLFF